MTHGENIVIKIFMEYNLDKIKWGGAIIMEDFNKIESIVINEICDLIKSLEDKYNIEITIYDILVSERE